MNKKIGCYLGLFDGKYEKSSLATTFLRIARKVTQKLQIFCPLLVPHIIIKHLQLKNVEIIWACYHDSSLSVACKPTLQASSS